jgi:ParB family chromosome partitioning protein
MANSKSAKGLGKGLSALLGEYKQPDRDVVASDSPSRIKETDLSKIDIQLIDANPWQPRTDFEKQALDELSASIAEYGLIQPITVRKSNKGRYQLIAGERRLRASKMAGLTEIPAYVRTASDMEMIEMGLIENIQRSDLNPIEIALSFQRLIDECNISQEDLAKRVAKSRTVITNHLRLLKLGSGVQKAICDNKITMGHAKMLASVEEEQMQVDILNKILTEELSVRQVEDLMRKIHQTDIKPQAAKVILPHHFQSVKANLKNILSTDVEIKRSLKGKGSIHIAFRSDEEFDRIIELLKQR